MSGEEKAGLQQGFAELLDDPAAFIKLYRQPAGENYKHFLWSTARALLELQSEQEKQAVQGFKSANKLNTLDDVVRYLSKIDIVASTHVVASINQVSKNLGDMRSSLLQLEDALEKGVDKLQGLQERIEACERRDAVRENGQA